MKKFFAKKKKTKISKINKMKKKQLKSNSGAARGSCIILYAIFA